MHGCVIFFILLGTPRTSLRLHSNLQGQCGLPWLRTVINSFSRLFLTVAQKVHHCGSFQRSKDSFSCAQMLREHRPGAYIILNDGEEFKSCVTIPKTR